MLALIVGCKKSESVIQPPATDKLESVLKLTGDDQLTAFNMLSGTEKVAIHTLHINRYVARKVFNPVQRNLIDELVRFNKAEYYDINSDAKEVATTFFAKGWLDRAKGQFSNTEIYTLAFSLDDIELRLAELAKQQNRTSPTGQSLNQLNPDRSPYNIESLPNCFCNVGSSFTCPKYSITYTAPGTTGSVSYSACSYRYTSPCDVEGGCGFGGWYLCDGNKCT